MEPSWLKAGRCAVIGSPTAGLTQLPTSRPSHAPLVALYAWRLCRHAAPAARRHCSHASPTPRRLCPHASLPARSPGRALSHPLVAVVGRPSRPHVTLINTLPRLCPQGGLPCLCLCRHAAPPARRLCLHTTTPPRRLCRHPTPPARRHCRATIPPPHHFDRNTPTPLCSGPSSFVVPAHPLGQYTIILVRRLWRHSIATQPGRGPA